MPNLLPARRVPVPSPAQGRGCSQDWGAFPGDTPGKLQPGKGRVTATEPGRLRLSPASSSSPARLHRHARQENKKKAFWRGGAVHPAGLKIFALCRARYPGSRIRPQPRSHAGVRPCPGAGGSRCPRGRAPAGPAPAHTPPVAPGAPRRAGPRAPAGCCRGTVRWSRCTHRAPGGTACTHRTAPCPARRTEQVCRHTCVHPRCVRAHLLARRPGVLTHTHTHTHRWNARCPHAHRTRIHTPASGLHAHPRAHSHTGAHTHTRTVRGHTQAYVAFTQKHSHTRCRVTHACPALHRHPPVCTHSHTTARTYRCVHTRPTPPPHSHPQVLHAHTLLCMHTGIPMHVYTHIHIQTHA